MSETRERSRRLWPAFAVLVMGVLLVWPWDADAEGLAVSGLWTQPLLISDTPNTIYGDYIPQLRADGNGRLLLAYNHGMQVGPVRFNPYYVQSLDEGETWSLPAPIRDQQDTSLQEVRIAFDGNNVAHAVWHSRTAIWHASEDQWPDEANEVATVGETERVSNPDLAIGPDGTLHVVWRKGNGQLFHAYSIDAGLNWTVSSALSSSGLAPAVAVDSANGVHVIYEERYAGDSGFQFDIYVRSGVFASGGMTWAPQSDLLFAQDPDAGLGEGRSPAILAQGERLHAAFARRDSDSEQYAYYVTRREGQDWSTSEIVSGSEALTMNTNVPYVLSPQMVLCRGRLHIYYHGAYGANQFERIIGLDGPAPWSVQRQVTFVDARTIRPSLACVGQKLALTYEEVLDPDKLHYVYFQSARQVAYLPLVGRP